MPSDSIATCFRRHSLFRHIPIIGWNPTAIPELRQNQFGFVASGPVYIPKVYDGRSKTFFMANYEGWRIINGSGELYDAQTRGIEGDFSGETYRGRRSRFARWSFADYGTLGLYALLGAGLNCMPVDPARTTLSRGTSFPRPLHQPIGLLALPTISGPPRPLPNQPEGVVNFIKNFGFPLTTNH